MCPAGAGRDEWLGGFASTSMAAAAALVTCCNKGKQRQDMYRCICLLGAASIWAGRAPRCCNTVAWFGSDRPWHYVEWRARAATCASKCVPNWTCCQTLSSACAHAIAGWLSAMECSTISHGAWLLHTLAAVFFIRSSWEDWPWECRTRSCLLNKVYDTCNAVVETARSRGTKDIRWWNLGGCPYQKLGCQPSLLARRSRSHVEHGCWLLF